MKRWLKRFLEKKPIWSGTWRLPWLGRTPVVWWWEPRDLWVLFYWTITTIKRESFGGDPWVPPPGIVTWRKCLDVYVSIIPAFPLQFRFWLRP